MGRTEQPELSVVVPVRDERECIGPLLQELVRVLRPACGFELVVVDDGSRDGTDEVLRNAAARLPELVVLRHRAGAGQSAALLTGVRHARAAWIGTLDGDGQNDPADLLVMLARQHKAPSPVRLFAGQRVQRRDSLGKRLGSRLANAVRRRILRDGTPDTGCGTKLFERAAFLELPRFSHMHRFLPALFRRDGWEVITVPVNHRPRPAGRSKYGNVQRLLVGVLDLVGVWWLLRRPVRCAADVVAPAVRENCLREHAA